MVLPDLGEQAANQRVRYRWQRTHGDATGRFASAPTDIGFQLFGRLQQRLDLRKQRFPRVRELDATTGAVEKAQATLALQGIDLSAQQGLVAVQKDRGTGQAAQFTNRHEGAPLVQVRGDVQFEFGGFGSLHG
ncbi:hypothetical protein D9M68_894390 [compost metagenome]